MSYPEYELKLREICTQLGKLRRAVPEEDGEFNTICSRLEHWNLGAGQFTYLLRD